MDTQILEHLGLHKNDTRVYKTLLSLGRVKTGDIINCSGVGSSQTYLALDRLIKRGLVSYQVRNNVRHYQAELPTLLVEESKQTIAALEKLSEDISSLPLTHKKRNFVNTFEGRDGFKKAFLQHIENTKEGEALSIIGYVHRVTNLRELRFFLKKCNELAVARTCSMRMILDEKFRHSLGERTGPEYEIRFMPSRYFSPCATNLCGNEVLLSVWGDEPLAISISLPSVVHSFAQNFDSLWETAKP